MADKPANTRKVIRKSWHRLSVLVSVCIRKDWRALLTKIHLGKITVTEAEQQLAIGFLRLKHQYLESTWTYAAGPPSPSQTSMKGVSVLGRALIAVLGRLHLVSRIH